MRVAHCIQIELGGHARPPLQRETHQRTSRQILSATARARDRRETAAIVVGDECIDVRRADVARVGAVAADRDGGSRHDKPPSIEMTWRVT
jgi:hypothetical protein